jgi:hypothetical protein
MKLCRLLGACEDWAAQGNASDLPEALRAHISRCQSCAAFVQAVLGVRELGGSLPTVTMSSARHDKMKFLLMSEARQSRNGHRVGLGRTSVRTRLLAAAAIVATTAAAAAASVVTRQFVQTRAAPTSTEPTEHAATQRVRPLAHFSGKSSSATGMPEVAFPRGAMLAATDPQRPSVATTSPLASALPSSATQAPTHPDDSEFARGFALLRDKKPAEAAKRFDALLATASLDSARRADVLYWSAQAHRRAGNAGTAISRSSQLLQQYPSAGFAPDAALMLGEFAIAGDQFDLAAQYLNKALKSQHAVVRDRAQRALSKLSESSRK